MDEMSMVEAPMSQPGQSVVPFGHGPVNAVPIQRKAAGSLCDAVRLYDWTGEPERILGWAMAQREIDLCTALDVFFNGQPTRFNYLPRRDVPDEYLGITRALDNICLRINSGYYLAYPGQEPSCKTRLDHWLRYQGVDRDEGRRGRWVLDEHVLAALQPLVSNTGHHACVGDRAEQGKWSVWLRRLRGLRLISRSISRRM